MTLVLVSDRPRQFQQIADSGSEPGLATHIAAADPHSVYATDTDMANHVAGADPHTAYQRETEKGVASGYASLDGAGLHPASEMRGAVAGALGGIRLAGDLAGTSTVPTVPGLTGKEASGVAAGLVTTHEGLADPHPGYLTPAEGNAAYTPLTRKVLGPYIPASAIAATALAAGPRSVTTVTVPDPGFSWIPLCFASLEIRSDVATTRPSVSIRLGSTGGTTYARGAGVDGANIWAVVSAVPTYSASPVIAPGSSQTFYLTVVNDYGGGWIQTTALGASMTVLVVPV